MHYGFVCHSHWYKIERGGSVEIVLAVNEWFRAWDLHKNVLGTLEHFRFNVGDQWLLGLTMIQ
jgi:hypothetical protein